MTDHLPDDNADRYLRLARQEERGRLTVYLGAAPGVGKTYRMLQDAARQEAEGLDVLVGIAETHGRSETAALLEPLAILPRQQIEHKGHTLEEFDIDAAIERHPDLILVDELAHTNALGSRHPKRWQDVAELLVAGIDVATTVNIQHIESLNDVVAGFTHIRVRETVPDSMFDKAELIVVDLPPEVLIERLAAGKVYRPDTAGHALDNFFTPTKLAALRETALRFAARNIDRRLTDQLEIIGESSDFVTGDSIVVAVSPGKSGASVVRHAKRMADMFNASWTAVIVESGSARYVRGSQREQLAENLAMASSLGASLITIAANDVGQALVDQARELRASQIVIGKSRRSRWFEWRHGSIAQEVIRKAEGIAVHVVPLEDADEKQENLRDPHPYKEPALALLLVGVTVGLLQLLQPWISASAIDLLLLLPVIISATLLRMTGAVWSAIWAALAYNFFFTAPFHTLSIYSPADIITFVVLAIVASVVGGLAGRVRRQAQTNAGVARLNASLARYAGLMGSVSDEEETARVVCREVGAMFDVEAIVVSLDGERMIVRGNEKYKSLDLVDEAAARWTLEHSEPTGRDTITLNASDWQFHPLKTTLGTMGALGIAGPSQQRVIRPDDATLLASLVAQTALAHERLLLESQARQVGALRERDELRSALLGSIAHDLRTPLTAVIAATEAIPAEGNFAEEVCIARDESRRLHRFLNDLLEASRIEGGAVNPRWESVDLTDVVTAVLSDLRQDRQTGRVVAKIDAETPFIDTDPLLLRHALINVIDNGLKFSPSESQVIVELRSIEGRVECRVLDRGPGLPSDTDGLFDRFHRLEGSDRVGGSGLGLWIAKNFIEAIGGDISAANREGGGAVFTVTLPSGEAVSKTRGAENA